MEISFLFCKGREKTYKEKPQNLCIFHWMLYVTPDRIGDIGQNTVPVTLLSPTTFGLSDFVQVTLMSLIKVFIL